jgi:eukaryotic-like serine/threonine-protein kinase
MSTPPSDWQRALSLFDEALSMSPEAREAWLDDTAAREPAVSPLLRKLLGAHRRVETNDVLATLPRQADALRSEPTGMCGQLIGPFELIEPIGHGGMGSVWRARYADGRLKRDVAIKLPAATHNPTALAALRERFGRERDFLAQLEHPNIARLYDTGISENGQPFLAMEYVAGEPIDAYCDHHRLVFIDRIKLFLQVLDAVDYAHRQLVLHRDLKPGNVLVDANGNVRLLDFGVAKLLPELNAVQPNAEANASKDLTEIAGAAMTLAYAAPEQITGAPLSTATDVYALGVMLHRLLTGSSPYQPTRDTRGALEDAVINNAPALASSRHVSDATLAALQSTAHALRRALTGDIDTILTKALKKRPDIRRHLAKQPISARPDSLWYRTNRLIARHRVAVAASALGVSALIATTGIAVWQAKVATASAARATKEAKRANTAQKFLTGLFGSADPEKNKTSTEFAKQVLERGLATAERELKDDPEAHALVLAQIGEIYDRLGLTEDALAAQQRRLALLERVPTIDANAITDARLAVGNALASSTVPANAASAMHWFDLAYERGVADGATPDRIVSALCSIADQHRTQNNLPQAQIVGKRALSLAIEALPDPSRVLSVAYATAAVISRDAGQLDDARAQFAKSLAIDATRAGRSPLDTFSTRTMLAQLEHNAGNYREAVKQATQAISDATSEFGEIQGNLAPARRIAVFAAERAGDIANAQTLASELLAPELTSGESFRVATAQLAMGRVHMSANEFRLAGAAFLAAAPELEKRKHWRVRLNTFRAELALLQGQTATALALLSNTLDFQNREFSAGHPEFATTYEWLAVASARANRLQDARAAIEESCRIRAQSQTAIHPQRVRCESYGVLLDPAMPSRDKTERLRALLADTSRNRVDQMLLLASLRNAISQIDAQTQIDATIQPFPILR